MCEEPPTDVFVTSDGYTLEWHPWIGEWGDGDLRFTSDVDSYPVDIFGERLEGRFV